MVLHDPILKAFSIAAFFSFTLDTSDFGAPSFGDGSPGPQPTTRATASSGPVAAPPSPGNPLGSPAPAAPEPSSCPEGMLLVEGDYCPDAEQTCLHWLDPPPYENLRCGEYARPAKCKVAKQHRRFCLDREEYTDAPDPDALPIVNKKWGEAKALCEARGARLCRETEWEFACEGPDMSPYPYGWKRDSTACNFDRTDLGGAEEKLTDHRAPLSAFPQCTSPFGAHDMVGNVDEWVEREGIPAPHRSALRGGWWLPGRNRCRAATLGHDETYQGKQVGFRCCKDADPGP